MYEWFFSKPASVGSFSPVGFAEIAIDTTAAPIFRKNPKCVLGNKKRIVFFETPLNFRLKQVAITA